MLRKIANTKATVHTLNYIRSNPPFAAICSKLWFGRFDTNRKMIAPSDRLHFDTTLAASKDKFASFADCRARIGLSF